MRPFAWSQTEYQCFSILVPTIRKSSFASMTVRHNALADLSDGSNGPRLSSSVGTSMNRITPSTATNDISMLESSASIIEAILLHSIPYAPSSPIGRIEILEYQANFTASLPPRTSLATSAASTNITVPLYWHVINNGSDASMGNVPDSQIEANVKVLNNGFNSTGFQFELKCIDRTLNLDWFNNSDFGNRPQTEMKRFLHQGGPSDLNVYTVAFASGDTLGYATFPYYQAGFRDGVVIKYTTLPGGTEEDYDQGKVLTHEVGHWTGLFHTFEGGCDGDGDYVDDTPAEATAAFGCQNGRDTCPSAGLDPIHNFMDYSADSCINEFTAGQVQRLKDQMAVYRGY